MASRSRQSSRGATGDSSSQRRNTRELASLYVAGKTFKVKFIGSEELPDIRGGNTAASALMKKIRQEKARLKASKVKSTVTLQFKALTIVDDKSKTAILTVPIQKVKFVCHDRSDVTVFAVIAHIDLPGNAVCYKLFCFQAEQKVAVLFVRSMNELFQLIHKMMQAKRQQSQSAQKEETPGPPSPLEEEIERSRFTEGSQESSEFGIAPPPPSYKAAISKTNSDIFKTPENVETSPVTLAPPPGKSASSDRIQTQQQSQPGPTPLPQTLSTPTQPALQPPPSSQSSGPRPRPRRQGSGQPLSPVRGSSVPVQLDAAMFTVGNPNRPLPPPPRTQASTQPQLASVQTAAASQDRPLPPPPRTQASSQPRIASAQSVATNQDRPLPPPPLPPRPTSPDSTAQSAGQNVWSEWRSLEGELQTIAQEVGMDTNTAGNAEMDSAERRVSFSFGEDPFNDEFFQTSFNSEPGGSDPFAPSPNTPPVQNASTDPFSNSSSAPVIGEALSNPPDISPPNSEDPFAAISDVRIPSPIVSTTSDPFADNDMATTMTAASGMAFEGGNAFEADFAAISSATVESPAITSFSFDSDFFVSTQQQSSATNSTQPSQVPNPTSFEENVFELQSTPTTTAPTSQPPESSFSFDAAFPEPGTTSSPPVQTEEVSFSFEPNFPDIQSTAVATSSAPTSQPSFEADFFSEQQNTATTSPSPPQTQTSSFFEADFPEPQNAGTSSAMPTQTSNSSPFEANFFDTSSTAATTTAPITNTPKSSPFEASFPETQNVPTTSASPSQDPFAFEANFSEAQTTSTSSGPPSQAPFSFEANFSEPQATTTSSAPPSQAPFTANFSKSQTTTTTSAPSKGGPLFAAPPSKQQQPQAGPSSGRSRPKPKESSGEKHFPSPPNTSQRSGNTSTLFSPGASSFSDSTNFSTGTESTLQLTNPLYQSQTTNTSVQNEPPAPYASSTAEGTTNTSKQDYVSDLSSVFQPQQPVGPQSFPGGPTPQQPVNAYPNNAMYQYSAQNPGMPPVPRQNPGMPPVPRQNPGMPPVPGQNPGMAPYPGQNPGMPPVPGQNPGMAPYPGQNPGMGQYPGQNPGIGQYPGQNPAMGPYQAQSPYPGQMPPGQSPQMTPSFQSPVGAGMYPPPQAGAGGNMVDSGNNPFTGEFTSPPYALHSSTPQSPPQGTQPPPTKQPPPPIVFDGPDPFAELLPMVIPKKDNPPEPPVQTVVETPKTSQPKKPSLNEMFNKKHGIGMLEPTKVEATSAPSTAEASGTNILQPSFDDEFGGGSGSPWVAF